MAGGTLSRRVRKLLVREPVLLDNTAQSRLREVLASNQALQTVHEFRERLRQMWSGANMSNEKLVQHLKDWIAQAEESRIKVLQDFAATLRGYASDVTRTFPASGKFSDAQRKLVQDVYDIQQALLADVKPGAMLSAIGKKCEAMLMERGYRHDHGPCHHVGLAVHDPSVDTLEEGMVITVEPGAYLRDQGMGCRIEDTVLVTATGFENLSGHLPASPDAIEALMKQRGVLEAPVGFGK